MMQLIGKLLAASAAMFKDKRSYVEWVLLTRFSGLSYCVDTNEMKAGTSMRYRRCRLTTRYFRSRFAPSFRGILALIFLSAGVASAAVPETIRFKHLVMEDENSLGSVLAIQQDRYGFMWVGGRLGLARYDGYNFVVFHHIEGDPDSLSANTVHDLVVDKGGALWIATEAGLDRYDYDREKFIRYQPDANDTTTISAAPVYKIHIDKNDKLWLATRGGLVSYNPDQDNFTQYPRHQGEEALAGEYVLGLDDDGRGTYYLATGYGLKVWNSVTGEIKNYQAKMGVPNQLQNNLIRSIAVDSYGLVWVGSETGLVRFNPITKEFIFYPTELDATVPANTNAPAPVSASVWDIFEDSDGDLWVATDGFGINLLDRKQDRLITHTHDTYDPDSLSSIVVRSVSEDRNGDIWLGHYPSGIDVFERYTSAFRTFKNTSNDNKSLSDSNVKPIVEDDKGNLWIGVDGGGLNYFDVQSQTYKFFRYDADDPNSLGSDDVLDIMVDHAGVMWIGTWSTAITKFDPKTGVFERIPPRANDPTAIQSGHVWSTLEDGEGTIWVGTMGSGLSRYVPETNSFVTYLYEEGNPESLFSGQIWSLLEDSRGYLWIATQLSLSRMNRQQETFRNFMNEPGVEGSISSNQIRALLEDSKGRLWIGTNGGGLNQYHYETELFTAITKKDGMPTNVVVSILEGSDGVLWMGTNNGIVSYDPESGDISHYDKSYGLQGNEFNVGSAYKAKNGDLIFGGLSGFTRFNPRDIKRNNDLIPPVVLTDIQILNKPVPIGEKESLQRSILVADRLRLSHLQNIVSFSFSALNYRSSDKNQYAYMLDGFDSDWNYVGRKRSTTYTNLDAGNYTFRVKAANNEGLWNEQGRSLNITITPAPWRTWWAYTLYLLAVLTLLSWYVFTQRKINRILEERVRDRTQELEKAYQKLEQLSLSDPLTNLGNRRFLERFIHADIAEVDRKYRNWMDNQGQELPQGNDLVFFILDLDKFKQINDTYGHSAGDKVLVSIADILKRASRGSDYVIRWGGEEFLFLARFVSRSNAAELAERFRQLVEDKIFDIGYEVSVRITCSIGFAFYPFSLADPQALSWEKTIDMADMALYAAKNSGRNGWVGVDAAGISVSTPEQFRDVLSRGKINIMTSFGDANQLSWHE